MTEPAAPLPQTTPDSQRSDHAATSDAAPAAPPAATDARQPDERSVQVRWQTRDLIRAALVFAAVFIVLRLAWFASSLILLAFLGVLFGIALSAGTNRLQRLRVPRSVGAPLVVLLFLGLLYAVGALSAPTIATQASELKSRLPEAVGRLDSLLSHGRGGALLRAISGGGTPAAAPAAAPAAPAGPRAGAERVLPRTAQADTLQPSPSSTILAQAANQLRAVSRYLFSFVTSTVATIATVLVVLFVAIYLAVDPDVYRRGILALVPPGRRGDARRVLDGTITVLRKWLITQFIAMVTIAVVTTVALLLLDVKAAFALGVLAGLLEFIPTVGPIISAIPGITMGFLDSPEKALYVAIAYIVIQQLEGQILIPVLMKGEMDLPPALTIFAQLLMALAFGFVGLMVAVPLLAAIIVPIKLLYVNRGQADVPAS